MNKEIVYLVKRTRCDKCHGYGHLARAGGVGIRNCDDCTKGYNEIRVEIKSKNTAN